MKRIKLTEKQISNVTRRIVKEDELGGMTSDPDVMKKEYGYVPGMKKDLSRDEIIEILNEIYELQLDKAPAIAQRRLDELFEKVGIGYWSYPSPDKMGESKEYSSNKTLFTEAPQRVLCDCPEGAGELGDEGGTCNCKCEVGDVVCWTSDSVSHAQNIRR